MRLTQDDADTGIGGVQNERLASRKLLVLQNSTKSGKLPMQPKVSRPKVLSSSIVSFSTVPISRLLTLQASIRKHGKRTCAVIDICESYHAGCISTWRLATQEYL